ncbi:MAG TPA: LytTR family DNA-binding domain-containing protein [Chitinophagaceae bacterium]|nr:LytTR family DNA-binding domain-containing protein [Chitinophagaceae bacterium]
MKALIIEDEEIIARVLQNKIRNVDSSIDIIDVLPSLKVAKKWFLNNAEPDMIFMDVQLSDGVSFDLFDHYKLGCPIVFTTAYDEYAIRAFKVNGVDYLLKPVDEEELKKAIDKCKTIVGSKTALAPDLSTLVKSLVNPGQSVRYKEKFIVNMRNQYMPVNTRDIACFVKEALNYIYLFNGDKHLLDFTTLDEVEELLDPRQFYRANRQYIINVDAIQAVKPMENAKLNIRLKEPNHKFEIDMSREKAPVFKKWLDR